MRNTNSLSTRIIAIALLGILASGCYREQAASSTSRDQVADQPLDREADTTSDIGGFPQQQPGSVAVDPSPTDQLPGDQLPSDLLPSDRAATGLKNDSNKSTDPAEQIDDDAELRNRALAAAEAGEVERADNLARQALAHNADDPQNVFVMAYVLAGQNRFFEAIRMLDRFMERDDSARLPMMGQAAEWAVFAGQWNDAEDRCLEILNEVPTAIPAHRVLARLYQRQGRRQEAAAHLTQLCRQGNIEEIELLVLLDNFSTFFRSPDDHESEPIGTLGLAHYQISSGDWQAARKTLEAMPERKPVESALLARIYAHQQDFENLSKWAEDVDTDAQVSSDYWFAIGALQVHQGDDVSAIKNLGTTVVMDHTDGDAYRLMSQSLARLGIDGPAAEAAARADAIEKSRVIADAFRSGPQRDIEQIDDLIANLEGLRRPFESLAWQAVAMMYAIDQVSQSQAEGFLLEINRQRLDLLRAAKAIRPREFLLCGVTLEMLQSIDPSEVDQN